VGRAAGDWQRRLSAAVRTTCPYCGVGCGVLAQQDANASWQVRGDPDHPANRGRLCSKGTALAATLGEDGRLLQPQVHGQDVGWDAALDAVASGLRRCIEDHGPESVALYVSGQLLTEDYYVANKLMKGYVGTANIDTNSRLCMSSAVSGHVRAFGEDVELRIGDDRRDLDDRVAVRVQSGHFQVDPDQPAFAVRVRRHAFDRPMMSRIHQRIRHAG